MFKKISLKEKIISVFIIITLFQGVLIALVTWAPYEERIRQHVFAENHEYASRIANDIDRMFTEKYHVMSIMAQNEEIKSMDEHRQQKALFSISNNMPEVQLAVLSNAQGQQIARWDLKPFDPSINYLDRSYFQQVMSTGNLAISDVIRAKSTNKLGVVVAVPVKSDQGDIIAVLIINIELKKLIETIQATRGGNSAQAYVVNNKEEIIIHPEKGLMEQPIKTNAVIPIMAVAKGESGSIEYYANDRRILASYAPVENVPWGVVVEQNYADAISPISAIRKSEINMVILLIFVSAGIGILMAMAIVRPIKKITEGSRRLANGDMSVRLPSGPTGELGQLIDSFNKMAEQLSIRQEELEEIVARRTNELSHLNEELIRIATIDGLTGLANRRYLNEFLNREWKRAMREEAPFSIMMIDVDYFKAYNDHFGHLIGDDALRSIALALQKTVLHSTDLAARFGGEEFMIILPGTTIEGALTVADRMNTFIYEANISHPGSLVSDRITVSTGVASCIPKQEDSLDAFLALADQALYNAKMLGRNQVATYSPPILNE